MARTHYVAALVAALVQGFTYAEPVLVRHEGRAIGNGHTFVRGETCFVVTASHVVAHSRDFEIVDRQGTVAAAQVIKRFRQEHDVDPSKQEALARFDVLVARVNKGSSVACSTAWDSSQAPKEALTKAVEAGTPVVAHHTRDDASAELQRLFLSKAADDLMRLSPLGASDVFRPGDSGSFLSVPGDQGSLLVGMIIQVDRGTGKVVALPQSWLNSLLVDMLREFGPASSGAVAMMAVDAANATLERAAKGRDLAQYGQGTAIKALAAAKVSLAGRTLNGVLLRDLDLQDMDLSRAELRATDAAGANFTRATLSDAVLSAAVFTKANLRGAKLEGTWGTFLDASEASFEGSNMRGALLYGAKLYGANLRSANLRDAGLPFADLRKADLSGADLSGAILAGALLEDAAVEGTIFANTDVTGAELPLSRLKPDQIKGMCRSPTEGAGLELHWRVDVEQGSRYENLDKRAYARTFPGFNLPMCRPRTAAQVKLVLTPVNGVEHLHGYYGIRIDEVLARKAGALPRLKQQISERFALHTREDSAARLTELAPKDSTRIAAMRRRASQPVAVDALPLSGDMQLLLALAQEPARVKEKTLAFAKERLKFELGLRDKSRKEIPANLDRAYIDPWGDFFPDGIVPQEVDEEMAAAHAEWLSKRAARVPAKIVMPAVYPDLRARNVPHPVLGGGMLGASMRVEMYNYEVPQDLREDVRQLKLDHTRLMRLVGPDWDLGLLQVVLAYPQPMVDYGIDVASLPASVTRDDTFLLIHHRILKSQTVGGTGRTRWLLVYVEPTKVSAVKGTREIWTAPIQRNDGGKLGPARTWLQAEVENPGAATAPQRATTANRP